jgi:hypothetical protein
MLSILNAGVVPLPVVCHPFGVKLSREKKLQIIELIDR